MAEIIRVFAENIPDLRFVGKRYDGFGHWQEWWENGWFDLLEQAMGGCEAILNLWENGGGYVGLEKRVDGRLQEYWIGMFTPADTSAPEGFASVDFAQLRLGTCWLYGTEGDIHDTRRCRQALAENGIVPWRDADGAEWSFENCLCPRYTTPDEKGNIILDYCFFAEK